MKHQKKPVVRIGRTRWAYKNEDSDNSLNILRDKKYLFIYFQLQNKNRQKVMSEFLAPGPQATGYVKFKAVSFYSVSEFWNSVIFIGIFVHCFFTHN